MRPLTLIFVLAGAMASAQNWALLNPAYKYNYSNDGSDTISNQIFVTQIDTLGVDSFRYQLNLIGVVCDTCPASLADVLCDTCEIFFEDPCDGCFVHVDQPQFLGYDCVRAANRWYFNAADTFLVQGSADVGTSWVFDASEGITAFVENEWPELVFGVQDTLQRILLSSGDTLLLSRSFGIAQFSLGPDRLDLNGVQGPEVGQLLPEPLAYFDYQPGDVLTYKLCCQYWCTNPGDNPYGWTYCHYWNIVINDRSELQDTLTYTTSTARTFPDPAPFCYVVACPNWPMPNDQWVFDRSSVVEGHPLVAAYPGQMVDTSICAATGWPGFLNYMAGHGLNTQARTKMISKKLGYFGPLPTSGVAIYAPVAPGLFPFEENRLLNEWYEEGIGLRKVEYLGSMNMSVELVGAIIGGDTIIQPPAIEWAVGMPEERSSSLLVSPNPASEAIYLKGVQRGIARILDLEGRILRTMRTSEKEETVDVRDLASGTYLLTLSNDDGQVSTRFSVLH